MPPRAHTSLSRGLVVLAQVVGLGEVRADDLAQHLGIPVSTVYRYLKDLREAGFVRERAGIYGPGELLSRNAGMSVTASELRRLARPTLEWLAGQTGETALLEVRTGNHALCLDQVESPHVIHLAFRIGQTLPLHAGATSRVLLAYAPQAVVDEVVSNLESYTPETPDALTLPRQLESIRRTAIAVSRGEYVSGALAIACPVMRGHTCVCSMSVAAPIRRATAEWQRLAKEALNRARHDLEALL